MTVTKKFLAIILNITICISMFPISVFAVSAIKCADRDY